MQMSVALISRKCIINIQDNAPIYVHPNTANKAHPPLRMSTIGASSKPQKLLTPSLRLQQAITSVWATRQSHLLAYKPCHQLHRFASKNGSTNGAGKPIATVGVWKRNNHTAQVNDYAFSRSEAPVEKGVKGGGRRMEESVRKRAS
jgi:hypothetical protein